MNREEDHERKGTLADRIGRSHSFFISLFVISLSLMLWDKGIVGRIKKDLVDEPLREYKIKG